MLEAYEGFRRDGQLPATYEVIYGASWGAAGRPATAAVGGVARIAPGSITRARPSRAERVGGGPR
jgi:malonyl-CoA O-methyltransferase